jgi:hypothetical protein
MKTCKNCGKPGLIWQMTRFGWRLFDPNNGNAQHICKGPPVENKAALDVLANAGVLAEEPEVEIIRPLIL